MLAPIPRTREHWYLGLAIGWGVIFGLASLLPGTDPAVKAFAWLPTLFFVVMYLRAWRTRRAMEFPYRHRQRWQADWLARWPGDGPPG